MSKRDGDLGAKKKYATEKRGDGKMTSKKVRRQNQEWFTMLLFEYIMYNMFCGHKMTFGIFFFSSIYNRADRIYVYHASCVHDLLLLF